MSDNIHPSPSQPVNQSPHQPTNPRAQPPTAASNNGSSSQNTYLSYRPAATGNSNYTSHFERLGFRIDNTTLQIRERFLSDLRSHVDGSHYKFLTKHDNARAFNIVIAECLSDFGRLYWGPLAREHLGEPDILKGFCCPRDANRAGSKLVGALELMFEYKAKAAASAKVRNGADWISKFVNFPAMTGRKADAPLWRSQQLVEPQLRNETIANELSDTSEEDVQFNFLDTKEMATRLRPLPEVKWSRYAANDVARSPTNKPQRRHRASDIATGKRQKPHHTFHAAGKYPRDSSTDSDTPLTARKKQRRSSAGLPAYPASSRFTPQLTKKLHHPTPSSNLLAQPSSTFIDPNVRFSAQEATRTQRSMPSIAPAQQPGSIVGPADSRSTSRPVPMAPKIQHPTPSITPAVRFPIIIDLVTSSSEPSKTDQDSVHIKEEPLFAGATARTVLLVSASNQSDKAPILVSLSLCKGIDCLFATLIAERGVSAVARKISLISATYTWNGKRHGMRKGNSDDWLRFTKAVRKAWDTEKFDDECEIEMMLHVEN